jgi:Arginase family
MMDTLALRLLKPERLTPLVSTVVLFSNLSGRTQFAKYDSTIGTEGIIKKIRERVGTVNPVYLSIDIDTLDPACKFSIVSFFSILTNLID